MPWFFYHFWWLIFPVMFFVFGGFSTWLNYKAQRDRMELLRTYAAQGKDPAGLARILAPDVLPSDDPNLGGGTGGASSSSPAWRSVSASPPDTPPSQAQSMRSSWSPSSWACWPWARWAWRSSPP